jgi:uncharacterized protein
MTLYKLLITGPFSCGKSEFIQSASELPLISTEGPKENPLPVADFGRITRDDHMIYLFGTSRAQEWINISHLNLDAIIILVDSASEFVSEARFFLPLVSTYPHLIIANKQDRSDALPLTAIHERLGLEPDVFLHPCDARNRGNVLGIIHEALKIVRPPME